MYLLFGLLPIFRFDKKNILGTPLDCEQVKVKTPDATSGRYYVDPDGIGSAEGFWVSFQVTFITSDLGPLQFEYLQSISEIAGFVRLRARISRDGHHSQQTEFQCHQQTKIAVIQTNSPIQR